MFNLDTYTSSTTIYFKSKRKCSTRRTKTIKDPFGWNISPAEAFGVNYICIIALLKNCSLSRTKGQRAPKIEFPYWGTPLKKNTKSRSGIAFYFSWASQLMEHVGKCGQIKKCPSPFWQSPQQRPAETPTSPSQWGLSGLEWETSGASPHLLPG